MKLLLLVLALVIITLRKILVPRGYVASKIVKLFRKF